MPAGAVPIVGAKGSSSGKAISSTSVKTRDNSNSSSNQSSLASSPVPAGDPSMQHRSRDEDAQAGMFVLDADDDNESL